MMKLQVRTVVIWLFMLGASSFLLPFSANAFQPNEVTLAWDANQDPDLEGYAVYSMKDYSSGPTTYTFLDTVEVDQLEDPDVPMITLTDLEDGQYYFALTAYDTEGNESEYSDELCVSISGSSISQCRSLGSSSGSGSNGLAGCFIGTVDHNSAIPPLSNRWTEYRRAIEAAMIFLLLILFFLLNRRSPRFQLPI